MTSRARRTRTIFDFQEYYPPMLSGNIANQYQMMPLMGTETTITIVIPDENATASVKSSVFQSILKAMATEDVYNDSKILGYYFSALQMYLPLNEQVNTFIEYQKWKRYQVSWPSEMLVPEEDLEQPIEHSYILRNLTQLILMLYKNISRETYEPHMRIRMNRYGEFLGIPAESNVDPPVILSFERAELVRSLAGSSVELRRSVLQTVLSTRAPVLAWTDMAYLTDIFNELCVTNSPLLNYKEVATEVRNLKIAFRKIISVDYPQYYLIMNGKCGELERNKFPTLIAVAENLKKRKTNLRRQFSLTSQGSQGVSRVTSKLVRAHLMRVEEDNPPADEA